MLCGLGAKAYAKARGLETVEDSELCTESQRAAWEKYRGWVDLADRQEQQQQHEQGPLQQQQQQQQQQDSRTPAAGDIARTHSTLDTVGALGMDKTVHDQDHQHVLLI